MSQGTNLQSNARVISKDELVDQENLASNIIVFNSKGKPQPGVNLLLHNKDKKIVTGFSSDEEGKYPPVSIQDPYIKFLTFSYLSHKEFSISTDSLFGYSTKIEVQLKDSNETFNNPDKIVKFIITNRTEEGFQLQPLNGNHDSIISLKKHP